MSLLPSRLFLRVISKNGEVYLLKVITLAVAFATSTLVILFSLNEFGFDRFHRNAESIFRMIKKNLGESHQGNRLSNKLPRDVYGILTSTSGNSLAVSRVKIMNGLTVLGDQPAPFSEKLHAADGSIPDVFSFHILDGSVNNFRLSDDQALLSSSVAQQLFGDVKVHGKKITIHGPEKSVLFHVAAVYKDFPQNSHEDFRVFIRFNESTIETLGFNSDESGIYGRTSFSNIEGVGQRYESRLNIGDVHYVFQPLPEIYFGPRVLGEDSRHGDRYSIWILLSLTALILFLAIASYVNLTSLTLPHRAKELAVRKLAGTNQFDLILIFVKESFVIVGISFFVGSLLLLLTTEMITRVFSVSLSQLVSEGRKTLLLVLGAIPLISVLSPLFLTWKFVRTSPNRLLSTETITFPRFKKRITVLQLGISLFLIVASLVIKRQINYSLLKEPGRNHDQVVYLSSPEDLTREGLMRTRSGWKTYHPNIIDVIAVSQLPDRINSKEINSPFYTLSVDPFFSEFFQLNMIRGNWFKPNTADSFMILNQRALLEGTTDSRNVIGVIEDINGHFNQPERPIKFKTDQNEKYNYVCVRILEVDIRRTIDYLSGYFGGAKIHILNKRFEEWLHYQDRLNALSNFLGLVAALLSCCAIYGLTVSVVRDKLKQLALHKILGASTLKITLLLVRQFMGETLIAILIFGPITYIFLTEFLRSFVYSTDLRWQDPAIPILYCVSVIMILCFLQAMTLGRRDLTLALRK